MKVHSLLSIVILFFLSGCGNIALAMPETLSTMRPIATQSPATPFHTATPTVDYQNTAEAAQSAEISAQATADAARAEVEAAHIAAAQITAQAEANALTVNQITQEAYAINAAGTQAVIAATSSAYPTSVSFTATQQSVINTQIPMQQALAAAQLTATNEAPEIMRRAKSAEAYNADLDFWVNIWGRIMMGVFFLFVPIALFTLRKPTKSVAQVQDTPMIIPQDTHQQVQQPQPVTLEVRRADTEYPSGDFVKLPCTVEEFTALVDAIIAGRGWAYGQWQSKDAPIKYETFVKIRRTALVNRWIIAVPNSDGRVMNTALGDSIFEAWQENQQSEKLEFTEEPEL